ncbi:hypothetical protein [Actinomadura sp. 9N215]|uniref:DUF7620 family protein n=1 Tax=Actinomadura sp. 9N215 TaxID=3375150 RepID=UPI00378954AC
MRVPWRRRANGDRRSAADEALEISKRQREHARERRHEFEHLTHRIREIRKVNHLAEAFDRAFGEGR